MFGFNKSKQKKDIEKRPAGKSRISIFFEIFFRKFWRICKLSVLYSLCALPLLAGLLFVTGVLSSRITDAVSYYATNIPDINGFKIFFDIEMRFILSFSFIAFFGLGPITAGFTYVLRNYAREDHSWMASDFFYNSKVNFLQALIVLIIDIIVFCAVTISFFMYSSMEGPLSYIKFAVIFFALLYMMIHLYIYPLMVTFKLSLKDIYKNSILLAFANAPRNFALLFILFIVHFLIPYYILMSGMTYIVLPLYFILELVAFEGLTGFMTNFFTYPSIDMLITASDKLQSSDE